MFKVFRVIKMNNNRPMKYLIYTLFAIIIFSCDQEDAWDCIQASGATVFQELTVALQQKLVIFQGTRLFCAKSYVKFFSADYGAFLLL